MAAPGIDGVTWKQYEVDLDERLKDLHKRIHRGIYRAQPSKRVFIPKADGKLRPLGIAALEDKVVQQAVVTVLNLVYEVDFPGFSYGFRPQRGAHDALVALWVGLMRKKVNWVLDADIRGFFDTINHEWLLKFVQHRIADPRILRLIRNWLRAGVSEGGKWSKTDVGTPQGAVVSPLLANVYLHPDKTRLIEFGRFAAENRRKRGERKPETFAFLGFTHSCGRTRQSSGFIVIGKPHATGSQRSGVAVSGIGYRGNVLLRSPYAGSRNPGFCTRIRTNALMPNTRSKSRMR